MIKRFFTIVLGVTLLISGVVKGIDPMGLAYKLHEYAQVFDFIPINLPFEIVAIILCGSEMVLGLLLLLKQWTKVVSVFTTLFIAIFTLITFEIYSNPYLGISECGCFGDAIKLTNAQTFWKNIILLIIAISEVVIAFGCDGTRARKSFKIVVAVIVIAFSMPIYSYLFLPPFDFLNYNLGSDVVAEKSLSLYDRNLNEKTSCEINTKDESVYIYLTKRAINKRDVAVIEQLRRKATDENSRVIVAFSDINHLEKREYADCYYMDETTMKSIIRADCGVVLLEKGVIGGKWRAGKFVKFNKKYNKLKILIWSFIYILAIILLFYLNKRYYKHINKQENEKNWR